MHVRSGVLALYLTLAPPLSVVGLTQQPHGRRHHPPPPMPQRLENYCEGESCHFGCRVLIRRRVPLRVRDSAGAPVVAYLNPGDTATVTTGSLWIRRPGLVVLRRDTTLLDSDSLGRVDTLRLLSQDTLYLLEYRELGEWSWWFLGKRGGGAEFWNGPAQRAFGRDTEALAGLSLSEPRREAWLRLETVSGKAGWWRSAQDVLSLLPGQDLYCAVPD